MTGYDPDEVVEFDVEQKFKLAGMVRSMVAEDYITGEKGDMGEMNSSLDMEVSDFEIRLIFNSLLETHNTFVNNGQWVMAIFSLGIVQRMRAEHDFLEDEFETMMQRREMDISDMHDMLGMGGQNPPGNGPF